MDVHATLREFADTTSLHGVPRIINARSLVYRAFWSFTCLSGFLAFAWSARNLLAQYYSYPKKVNMEITQGPVPFPAVTVCNMDHLDLLVVERLERMFSEESAGSGAGDSGPEASDTSEEDPFMRRYVNYTERATSFTRYQNEPAPLSGDGIKAGAESSLKERLQVSSRLGLVANLGLKLASAASVRAEDFIVSCRFMDEDCNVSAAFTTRFDPYYFNCFTFQPQTLLASRSTRLSGVEYGLSLLLFAGSAGQLSSDSGDARKDLIHGMLEVDPALTGGQGARAVVHAPDTLPYPKADGYDVPSGHSVTLGVRARENRRIGLPHGNCTEAGGSTPLYTLISCQNQCIQRRIMQTCGCVDNQIELPQPPAPPQPGTGPAHEGPGTAFQTSVDEDSHAHHSHQAPTSFAHRSQEDPASAALLGSDDGLSHVFHPRSALTSHAPMAAGPSGKAHLSTGLSGNQWGQAVAPQSHGRKRIERGTPERNSGAHLGTDPTSPAGEGSPGAEEEEEEEEEELPFCLQMPWLPLQCVVMQELPPDQPQPECARLAAEFRARMRCRKVTFERMTVRPTPEDQRALDTCACFPPCADLGYDLTYSLALLPVDSQENNAFYSLIDSFTEALAPERKGVLERRYGPNYTDHIRRHTTRLNVHIADINVMRTTESPDYDLIRLVSDLGGQLGLWIGVSVITLVEVLQLGADVLLVVTSRGAGVTSRGGRGAAEGVGVGGGGVLRGENGEAARRLKGEGGEEDEEGV